MAKNMKAMCEDIARAGFLIKRDGSHPTPKQIFEYSPTGELGMIFVWHEVAKEIARRAETGGR